jgi:peptide/nickel transport system substrate-binding protein
LGFIAARSWLVAFLVGIVGLAACAPGQSPAGPAAAVSGQPAVPARPLVILIRVEPNDIAAKSLRQAGTILATTKRLFNATLALLDDRGVPRPYLVEALPQLDTESWRLLPDGRMETTYRLKPNLSWHDGMPLTTDDFVFAWRVYTAPELGSAASVPQSLIEEVRGADGNAVLIRWRQTYAEAGILTDGFAPLPRHILGEAFEAGPGWAEAFAAHPYWTREYVGVGPYRVERWEPGAEIEAAAFAGHVLGRPRIERLVVRWNSDPNAALAIMLAGEAHLSADTSLQTQHASVLRREWAPRNGGAILLKPDLWRAVSFQLRPDLATPRAILDARVRKAFAHAIDKGVLNDVLFEGNGFMSETIIPPTVDYFPPVDAVVPKYPLDPRRGEQLMVEAGFERPPEGMYVSRSEGRTTFEVKTNAGAQFEAEMSILASGWRQAGFDMREAVNPAALAQDSQVRAVFPSLFTFSSGLGDQTLIGYTTSGIPRPENRWTGQNRGGWANPEFDRLVERYTAILDWSLRTPVIVEMARLFNEELPAITLYFQPSVFAHVAALQGPRLVAPQSAITWNIQEWYWQG